MRSNYSFQRTRYARRQIQALDGMNMRALFFLSGAFLAAGAALAHSPHTYKPPQGYVPDAITAIRIALAVWKPIYGQKQIASEKPYVATLKDGVWTVRGTLPHGWDVGGVAIAEISKQDGTILRVSHGM